MRAVPPAKNTVLIFVKYNFSNELKNALVAWLVRRTCTILHICRAQKLMSDYNMSTVECWIPNIRIPFQTEIVHCNLNYIIPNWAIAKAQFGFSILVFGNQTSFEIRTRYNPNATYLYKYGTTSEFRSLLYSRMPKFRLVRAQPLMSQLSENQTSEIQIFR